MPAMPSPFPGMDPYLEARWSDVHAALCPAIRAALQPLLPPGLRARANEDVLLESLVGDRLGRFEADSVVVEGKPRPAGPEPQGVPAGGGVEPVLVEKLRPLRVDRWVQVIDTTSGNRVVTAIEVLSPWNKRSGRLNRLYRRKLGRYQDADVNVVELDLLRSRRTRLEVTEADLPPEQRAPYYASVHRAAVPDRWEVYPMPLRGPLPPIPVPLRVADADVMLLLQPILARIYEEGAHDDIDYGQPPTPRLGPEDEAWADAILRAAGRR
jgi:hypothetical protein